MKKLALLLVMIVAANFAMAQKTQRTNAFNYNKTAQQYISSAEQYKTQNKVEKANKDMQNAKLAIKKAKDAIDAASLHEQTMNDPRTWNYLAIIYYKIGAYSDFNDLEPNAMEISLNAFKKVIEIDPNYTNENANDVIPYIKSIGANFYDLGANNFNNSEFDQAVINFKKSYDAALVIGEKDNGALLYAALAAVSAKQYDKGIEFYQMLLANGYNDATVYQNLAIAYRGIENNDMMLQVLAEGLQKYPDNAGLINEKINAYLSLGREAEVIDQLKEMASKFTDNPIYNIILGTIYGNAESSLFNFDEAVNYYKKAIEVDPNNENSYINIGSLYIDKAAALYNQANELPIDKVKEYDDLVAQAKGYDEQALPYVEKAYQLVPNDEAIKHALRTMYIRLKMNDKAKELE